MKKLIIIILLAFVAAPGFAQLTLSEKTTLADNSLFRSRVFQALFNKANFFVAQGTPANLKAQKQQNYAKAFVKGGSASIDIYAAARFWLANYNGVAVLDGQNQPTDSQILNSAGLDTVFDSLAGVVSGDDLLPIQ